MFFNIRRKTLALGSLFNKVEGLKRSATFLKIVSNADFSCGYCKVFKNSFLIQHLWWLLLTVLPWYSKVSWGACYLILCLHMLSTLIKTFTKYCTNNYLLSRNKTISCLLELIGHMLLNSEYVLEKH